MNTEGNPSLNSVEFANPRKEDAQINERIDQMVFRLLKDKEEVYPGVIEYFRNPSLYHSLPTAIKDNDQELYSYIRNSAKFSMYVGAERGKKSDKTTKFFGPVVKIAPNSHADGRARSEEEGYQINLVALNTANIDPNKVLFFRVTQPTETPKPEYYWTSDYFETLHGLTAEISPDQRRKAIILIADLNTIYQNGGLIEDVNDDSGISVRQINTKEFDQKRSVAVIKSPC